MTNIKKQQLQQKMITMLSIDQNNIEEYIARSIGYFNKLLKEKDRINEYDIINYHFILDDIKTKEQSLAQKINYGNITNPIIQRYGKEILDYRYIDFLSYDKIVFKLAKVYKKKISKSSVQKFILLNQEL